ncbi:MAG TPA: HAD family hydrolase [Chloroflexota bacterium]|nr:HAD family hydrolase [Chloroflexota bacterium]
MPADAPRYRMVVADIDGTLLDSSAKITPRVAAAIERARRAGLYFTLATGRRYVTTKPILEQVALPADEIMSTAERSPSHDLRALPPVILQTGAMVVSADGDEVLFRNPLPRADARRALVVLVTLGLQPIAYEDRVHEQRLFSGPAERDTRGARQYLSGNPHLVMRRPYEDLLPEGDPLQLAVIGDREPLDAAIPYLTMARCRTILSYSANLDSYFMEVFHKTCNKGHATELLARRLGFGMDQVVCMGDNWNDVEMLAMAGCGLAVGNAAPGIAPHARRLAPSNDEHAVAVILDQILAGEEPGVPNPAYDVSLRP